ncbi:MAG: tRNA pseudouridine(55) synthase TruB [Sphaerospermopsis sp.]|nr:tRNA pseudouridine(55) synthase TruB [Sphaerospermopsis sp.]
MLKGFLNLNKPDNWTSHDCVARVRKLLRLKRVGHAGTLDPAATGVLPIALGRATRLLQFLPGNKAYQATVRFGVTTTTDDLQGEVLTCEPCPELKLTDIEREIGQFIGLIRQIPPSYSAIQVDGKRLYDLARQGEIFQAPTRTVQVFKIDILAWRVSDFPELDLAISCGTGTYIRAIARDLGVVLKTGATLAKLTRTESSGFDLENSLSFLDIENQLQTQTFEPIAPDRPLENLPFINLEETIAKKWCQGQKVPVEVGLTDLVDLVRVYRQHNNFLGIGKIENRILIPQMVFEPL